MSEAIINLEPDPIEGSNLDLIPNFLKDGLEVLGVCEVGKKRSPDNATLLNEFGVPSTYLQGGVKWLSQQPIPEQILIARQLAPIPNVAFFLDDLERSMYARQIERIQKARDDFGSKPAIFPGSTPSMPKLLEQLGK
jgi:hypothetical protein